MSDELWNRLVNSKWPKDMPVPTEQEAITGAKRLYRKAMGKPFTGDVKITSGNRHTWIRMAPDAKRGRGYIRTMFVNPAYRHRPGWPGIVHSISHYAHSRKHPNDRPHSDRQAYIERDLTDYALAAGFHEGKLKRVPKPKPHKDLAADRAANIDKRIAAWETKEKRAKNALKKLRNQKRYYDKKLAERQFTLD